MSLFDESEVVAGHQRLPASIAGSTATLHACADLIRKVLLAHSIKNDDEIAVSLLGFRIVNDVAASTKLAECGYFPQASALLRDLAEIGALALHFSNQSGQISIWRGLRDKERYNRFGWSKIKKHLDDDKRRFLNDYFGLFSELGTHPSSASFAFHNKGGVLQIGPHINQKHFVRLHQDMARLSWHVTDAAGDCWNSLTGEDAAALFPTEQKAFVDSFGAWEKDSS